MDPALQALRQSYDAVAEEYVARIYHELEHKPLDREWLDRFARQTRERGPVCEVGCGPGHVARYLHERGVDIAGLDLSAHMVTLARQLNPGIEFHLGNLLALEAPAGAWAGLVAFYAIIHLSAAQVALAFQEFYRVLRPVGVLLLAFHAGAETIHRDEWWGKSVSVDTFFFQPAEIIQSLTTAGFRVEDVIERPPYAEVEYPSQRAYILARRLRPPEHSSAA